MTPARPSNAELCPDVESIRAAYPALRRERRGRPPIYFDNAATVLKPQPVIDTMCEFLSENGSNVHRGIPYLSIEGSHEFESARDIIARYIEAHGTAGAEQIETLGTGYEEVLTEMQRKITEVDDVADRVLEEIQETDSAMAQIDAAL